MSTTTTSACCTTRSLTSWCGLAPVGPDPTMTRSAAAWPSSTIAAAMSAATWASVRPGRSHSPTRAWTRSMAAPARRSCSSSTASLRIRSSRSTGPASCCSAAPASRRRSACSAGVMSDTATGPPGTPASASAYASSPSTHVRTSTPRPPSAACPRSRSRRERIVVTSRTEVWVPMRRPYSGRPGHPHGLRPQGEAPTACAAYAGGMATRHRASVEPWRTRLLAWFGVDEAWERVPDDPARARRTDTVLAAAFLVAGSLGVELLRSIDALGGFSGSYVWPHVAVAAGTVPLVWRRSRPLLVAAWLSLHFFVVGITLAPVAMSMPMQVVYFLAIFTGVAWARDRRAMLAVVTGIVLLMFGWLTWQLAVGSGVEEALGHAGKPLPRQGLFSPSTAYVVYTLLVNVLYFGGAIIGGQAA